MSSRLLLHIGANKTGSSAIQQFLRVNATALRELGYLVPDRELGVSDRISGEHVFAFQQMINQSNRVGLESKIRSLIQSDAETIVMSAENLSNPGNFQFFINALRGVNCKVILYIRRQDELLTSSWQQWYSKREVDFNGWLVLALQRYGHWMRCIEGWESAAGPGNVVVRVFQQSDLKNGDVVDDFIDLAEMERPGTRFTRTTSLANPSYSDLITPIVSGNSFIFANEHDNDFYKMVEDLTGQHYVVQKKVSLITRQHRDKIVEFYRIQNEAICRRYFAGRARLFESVDHSKYEYLTSEEFTKRQMEFLAALVYGLYKRNVTE